MLQGNNANAGAEDYWKSASFTFKFYCITSALILLLSLFVPAIIVFCIDVPQLTIWSFQLWRLFLSMYGQIPNIMSIINLLFSFMWIYRMLKDEQGSTVYKMFEVIIINVQIHLVFNLISLIFTLLFKTQDSSIFLGYGWFPIIIIYQFRASVVDPEAQRRFCCLPFLIKSKYFPWVILAFITLFTTQFFCFLACAIVGYYQQVIRKSMIIKLPFGFYTKLQSCLPARIKNRADFVKIDRVQATLKQLCTNSRGQISRNNYTDQQNARSQPNPFDNPTDNRSVVQASTPGSAIGGKGGNSVNDFRNYWANKDEKQQKSTNPQKQIQIQPQNHYGSNQSPYQSYKLEDNSYATFKDNNSPQALVQQKQQSSSNIKNKKVQGQHSDLI